MPPLPSRTPYSPAPGRVLPLLSFLAVLLLVHPFRAESSRGKLTFDRCHEESPCASGRICLLNNSSKPCPRRGRNGCSCQPQGGLRPCNDSATCDAGERCVRRSASNIAALTNTSSPAPGAGATAQFCASCQASLLEHDPVAIDFDAPSCLPRGRAYLGGYSGDACSLPGTAACVAPRECARNPADGPPGLCGAGGNRTCECRAAPRYGACAASMDCPFGERCVVWSGARACLGCRRVALYTRLRAAVVDADGGGRCLTRASRASASPAPPASGRAPYEGGRAWDPCAAGAPVGAAGGCGDGMQCSAGRNKSAPRVCRPRHGGRCVCVAWGRPRRCAQAAHCGEGERCVRALRGGGAEEEAGQQFCVGCLGAPLGVQAGEWELVGGDDSCVSLRGSPTPSTPAAANLSTVGACVAARHLAALPAHRLVFGARHRSARVLCDRAGSCATAGHMVVFRGEAMRMTTYCARPGVACRQERMQVNSPRWRRGARVASRTGGLEFTALAARWGTGVEERVLAGLVRMGA